MFFIPGWLISILTFPGVIVHETAHRFFADMAGVPVYDVCYFRIGNPAGYVVHGPPVTLKNSFLISVGPLIVNTVLCSLLTFAAVLPFMILDDQKPNPIFYLLAWVGYSIGMHAFPSAQDMRNFVDEVRKNREGGMLLVFAKLFSGLMRVANGLRIVWFDLLYAVGVSMLLPWAFRLT
jgi:Putative zincin peptidase